MLPLLGLVAASGTGGANALQTYKAAQDLLEKLITSNLPVGWKSFFLIHGQFFIFNDKNSWMFYLPLTTLIVGLSSVWYWRQRPVSRGIKIFYITLCWMLWSWSLGNVGIVLYIYFLNRFWNRREETLDHILIIGLNLGAFIGPVLTWITLGVWDITHWLTLVFILLQMFRFQYLTYFVALVPLLLMFQNITQKIQDPLAYRLIQLILIAALVVQPHEGVELSVYLFVFLGLISVLIVMSNSSQTYFTEPILSMLGRRRLLVSLPFLMVGLMVIAFLLTWGGRWNWDASIETNLNYLIEVGQKNKTLENQFEADYYDMTNWLQTNTPVDSLVHFHQGSFDRSGFFRFLTQRSLLFTWVDTYEGQFNPTVAERSRQITKDIGTIPVFLAGLLAVRYDVNYVVLPYYYPTPLPIWGNGHWYVSEIAHTNTTYTIYRVDRVTNEDVLRRLLKIKAAA
jgi:hypothetical protein